MGVTCPALKHRKIKTNENVTVFNTLLKNTPWTRNLAKSLGFEPISIK